MKDSSFSLKVSDLLNNPGTTDTVLFTDKFSTSLPQLVDKGITTTIEIMGLSDQEISIVFKDILATLQTECDRCGQPCRHTVKIKEILSKGAFSQDLQKEDIILIDQRTGMIDLEDFLVETIILASPVTVSCKKCEELPIVDDSEFEEKADITRKYE